MSRAVGGNLDRNLESKSVPGGAFEAFEKYQQIRSS